MLLFQPTAAKVHQKAGTWFDDEEIYEWLAKNLHRVREPSYGLHRGARRGRPEPVGRITAEVLASPAYDSTAAHVKAFVQRDSKRGQAFLGISRL